MFIECGAQRSLNFEEYIPIRSYEQAEKAVFWGDTKQNNSKGYRWHWGETTTTLLLDYVDILSALIAKNINESTTFMEECKECEKENKEHPKVPETTMDKLLEIWNKIFPQRNIYIKDSKVIAEMKNTEKEEGKEKVSYLGKEMSDGERVALYLIAQCLCVPKNKTIIIDEPELHMHRSIMNRLWNEIETYREDCLFIYITHDTQFAASHIQAEKIWVKNFDGKFWTWEKVKKSELPEQLLLDILGNRKNVLFVEGTKDSYDTKIYSEIFKDYYIVPCGSCMGVIAQTKAMNKNSQLHHLKCYGIIDRDYRSEYEIESYKKYNIYTLKVAEVENLFLVEEILEIMNNIMGFSDKSKVEKVKNYIINERFKKEMDKQICEATVANIKFKLNNVLISNKNEEEIKKSFENEVRKISFEAIKLEQEKKFKKIADGESYKEILQVFNCKSLASEIGHFLGLDNKEYREFVIRQLKVNKSQDIINALMQYFPEEITM